MLGDPGQKPVGLCGSGIIDVICELFIHGIINAKGQICRAKAPAFAAMNTASAAMSLLLRKTPIPLRM